MATVEEFAELVEKEQRVRHGSFFTPGIHHDGLVEMASKVTVRPGLKYTRVDVDGSGKYMVVNETGEIFGIKAYGVIHKGHRYGTLSSVRDWDWSGYVAVRHHGVCPECGDSYGSRYHEVAHSADVDTASTEELEAAASIMEGIEEE